MAANTFTLIAATSVGSGGTSNITFSSIPQTYKDLILFFSLRSNSASAGSGLYESLVTRINGSSSGGDYSSLIKRGDGTGGPTYGYYNLNVGWSMPGTYVNAANVAASTFSNFQMYIPNYTSSNIPKTISSEGSAPTNSASTVGANSRGAGRYVPTTAITSISLSPEYGSAWVQYSTASLYGIKNS
jgi:hypothetical protein